MIVSARVRRPAATQPKRPNLGKIVAKLNLSRDLFRARRIDPDRITVKEAIEIRSFIECELSPEWLHEDGEITADQARAKERVLRDALTELTEITHRPWN